VSWRPDGCRRTAACEAVAVGELHGVVGASWATTGPELPQDSAPLDWTFILSCVSTVQDKLG